MPGRGRDLKAGIVGYKPNSATIMSVLHIDGVGLGGSENLYYCTYKPQNWSH